MKPTMQILLAVAMATLFAAASCSSIYRPGVEVDGTRSQMRMGQFEETQNQMVEEFIGSDGDSFYSDDDSDEDSDEFAPMQERSILSTFKTIASIISQASNRTLRENILRTAAGKIADVALTAVTGTKQGAALAKTAIGVVGEALETVTAKLSKSALSNNTLASALLNKTSSFGTLLSDYGDGDETLSTVVTMVHSITSGNLTLPSALKQAGILLIDNTFGSTSEQITNAGKTIVVVGGVIETVASSMSDSANTTSEELIDEILSRTGAETIVKVAFTVVDKVLNVSIEDIMSEKLDEIDNSTATLKEKVLAISAVIETIGETLVTIGETAEDLGSSSVSDYASIIKEALSSLSSSSSSSTETTTSS